MEDPITGFLDKGILLLWDFNARMGSLNIASEISD